MGRYEHRKSDVTLNIIRGDGTAAAKQQVTINQRRHQFLFGSGGFDAVELAGGNPDGSPLSGEREALLSERMEKIIALNNYVTLPFYLGTYEPVEGQPNQRRTIAAAKWLADRGVTVKGHPLCWHTVYAPWMMKYDNDTVLKKMRARIKRDVSAFDGSIDMWDVINEVVIMPIFDKYDNPITRLCKELGRVEMIKEMFCAAKKANPHAVLLLNDFDTSTNYEILIEGCLAAGIPIDVIGVQSHQHQGYWGLDKLHTVLERFCHFNLPVHFTENTLISGDLMPAHIVDLNDWQVPEWPTTPAGEERQAREAVEMYETLFACPQVEAVTTWDPQDGKWLGAPSGFLRKDNSPKPVYHALMEKIKGEWWTADVKLVTDENGSVDFRGFRGDYTLCCGNGEAAFALDGKNPKQSVILG